MATIETLEQLFASELRFELSSFVEGGGFKASLGDEEGGIIWDDEFPTVALAVEGLINAVLDAYPESRFAASYHGQGI